MVKPYQKPRVSSGGMGLTLTQIMGCDSSQFCLLFVSEVVNLKTFYCFYSFFFFFCRLRLKVSSKLKNLVCVIPWIPNLQDYKSKAGKLASDSQEQNNWKIGYISMPRLPGANYVFPNKLLAASGSAVTLISA